jgi:hypothetical protein
MTPAFCVRIVRILVQHPRSLSEEAVDVWCQILNMPPKGCRVLHNRWANVKDDAAPALVASFEELNNTLLIPQEVLNQGDWSEAVMWQWKSSISPPYADYPVMDIDVPQESPNVKSPVEATRPSQNNNYLGVGDSKSFSQILRDPLADFYIWLTNPS